MHRCDSNIRAVRFQIRDTACHCVSKSIRDFVVHRACKPMYVKAFVWQCPVALKTPQHADGSAMAWVKPDRCGLGSVSSLTGCVSLAPVELVQQKVLIALVEHTPSSHLCFGLSRAPGLRKRHAHSRRDHDSKAKPPPVSI